MQKYNYNITGFSIKNRKMDGQELNNIWPKKANLYREYLKIEEAMREILEKKDESAKTEATVGIIVALVLNGFSLSYDKKEVRLAKADGNEVLELSISIEKVNTSNEMVTTLPH